MKSKLIFPPRLSKGDEIRVIAPSRSLAIVKKDILNAAIEYLSAQGYNVTFAHNANNIAYADSSNIQDRVDDIHNAFLDKNVKAILTAIGGFNSNQVLEYLDYSIIRCNPKILCGYSDITALLNSIYAKTGLITYHGPHFSTFGFDRNREYTTKYFEKCLNHIDEYQIFSSSGKNYAVVQEGECEGIIIGGNLCTLNLLQGTEFMPDLQNVILFIEDDNIMGDYFICEFERNLQSLLQVKGLNLRGIVFGSFSENCNLTIEKLQQIVKTKKQLNNIPIVYNADFGHVFPFFTFPVGGRAKVSAYNDQVKVIITEH